MGVSNYPLISAEVAAEILEDIKKMHKARFIPNLHNKGVDGSIGDYLSSFTASLSKTVREKLLAIAPKYDLYEVEEVVVNKFPAGGYIPKHIDGHRYFACEVLVLEDSEGGLGYMSDDVEKFHPDKAGHCNRFDNIKAVHWVDPVEHERYSVVFLYL